MQRAKAYLKIKRKHVKSNSEGNIESILKANGVEMEKITQIDKYHPGFLKYVVHLATNPEAMVSKSGTAMEKRARKYLQNKRKASGYQQSVGVFQSSSFKSSASIDNQINFSVGESMNASLSSLGMEKQSFGYFEKQRGSSDGVRRQLSQQFNYSEASVEPKVIYNGPVYNNCSFGNISYNKDSLSNVSGKKGVFPIRFSKKRRLTREGVSKKNMFKSAEELGLSLN